MSSVWMVKTTDESMPSNLRFILVETTHNSLRDFYDELVQRGAVFCSQLWTRPTSSRGVFEIYNRADIILGLAGVRTIQQPTSRYVEHEDPVPPPPPRAVDDDDIMGLPRRG